MLLVSVHDILHPALDLGRIHARPPGLAHGDLDLYAAVVDQRDGADEELRKSR